MLNELPSTESMMKQARRYANALTRRFRLVDPDSVDLIADEAVVRLIRAATQNRIDSRRGEIAGLLYGIAINVARELSRKQRIESKRARILREVAQERSSPTDVLRGLAAQDVRILVEDLLEEERDLISRRYGVGDVDEQPSKEANWSPTDSVRLHRLLQRLRQEWSKLND